MIQHTYWTKDSSRLTLATGRTRKLNWVALRGITLNARCWWRNQHENKIYIYKRKIKLSHLRPFTDISRNKRLTEAEVIQLTHWTGTPAASHLPQKELGSSTASPYTPWHGITLFHLMIHARNGVGCMLLVKKLTPKSNPYIKERLNQVTYYHSQTYQETKG